MPETITLNWHPLLHVGEFPREVVYRNACKRHENSKPRSDYKLMPCPSVYIWGFAHRGEFIPYCVGSTGRPFERAMQHYSNLRGGLYPIYHQNSLREFYMHKNDHKSEGIKKRWVRRLGFRYEPDDHVIGLCRDKGMLYTPESPWALGELMSKPKVLDEVDYLCKAFRFAWAEVAAPHEPGIAESALADRLGRRYLQSTVHSLPGNDSEFIDPSLEHVCANGHAGPLVTRLSALECGRASAAGRTRVMNDDSWAGGPVIVPWDEVAG